jgi:hypothetical protein
MKKKIFLLVSFLISIGMNAQILHVPVSYPTIQQAIDSAFNGDTVLVDPGIYRENINFQGKLITVASRFLTSNDTSFISQTIIKSYSDSGPTVEFNHLEDANALLAGFQIMHDSSLWHYGGVGISCDGASPTLMNLNVTGIYHYLAGGGISCLHSNAIIKNVRLAGNSSIMVLGTGGGIGAGGGICLDQSSPVIMNVEIVENHSHDGAGIFCSYSSPLILNTVISGNNAIRGGGVYCEHSAPVIVNTLVSGNIANLGGGLFSDFSTPLLDDVTLCSNTATQIYGMGGPVYAYGGAVYANGSRIAMTHNNILNNRAITGGAIYCSKSVVNFDTLLRCNIYHNHAITGNEIFTDTVFSLVVDTFTVKNPGAIHLNPLSLFTYDILHGKIQPVNADLYVSPEGNDGNSGLTPSESLKTMDFASQAIQSDSLNNHVIYLMDGIYSDSSNQEFFPVYLPDYTDIKGLNPRKAILDGTGVASSLIRMENNHSNKVSGIVLRGAGNYYPVSDLPAAISILNSTCILENLEIRQNQFHGISCAQSSVIAASCVIGSNYPGGLICNNSKLKLNNITMEGNYTDQQTRASAIEMSRCSVTLNNSILLHNFCGNPNNWNTYEGPVYLATPSDTLTIGFSDLQGGRNSIINPGGGCLTWLDGNVDTDPMFDTTSSFPWTLNKLSPCVDAGSFDTSGLFLPGSDITGNPRIWNHRIDMGAYEWINVGVDDQQDVGSGQLRIKCWPNPAMEHVNFSYHLDEPTRVTLRIYDESGKEIATLVDAFQLAGEHSVCWEIYNPVSGLFSYGINTPRRRAMGKLIITSAMN